VRNLVRSAFAKLGVGLYRKGNEASLLEPAHLQRFLSHFEVDCVFDVGANEGQYARQLRAIGYGGLILSFEPHPEVYERLAIAAKDDLLWHTFHLALDAQVRQLDFHLMASSQFSSLHAPSTAGTDQLADLNRVVQKVSLTTATLNDLLPKLRETHAGRGRGTRTHDPRFWRPMLYQLSYTPRPAAASGRHATGWRRPGRESQPFAHCLRRAAFRYAGVRPFAVLRHVCGAEQPVPEAEQDPEVPVPMLLFDAVVDAVKGGVDQDGAQAGRTTG
jgi:FkbM family methyltransferase